MKRIFINIFFELFLFIYYRENIYCCCCFQCAEIETKEEKDARLRNEQIKKENALRNKLFNIICLRVKKCFVVFKNDKVKIDIYISDSFAGELNRIEKFYKISTLSPKDNDTQIVDVSVNEENNFVIKHEGDNIVVKFYVISDTECNYRVYVYGRDLPSRLGIRKFREPIIFYYSYDEEFFKYKKGKIIEDEDMPVNDFINKPFDCLKCTYFSDNCFYIDFYKVCQVIY